jgi:hypothetical protein
MALIESAGKRSIGHGMTCVALLIYPGEDAAVTGESAWYGHAGATAAKVRGVSFDPAGLGF